MKNFIKKYSHAWTLLYVLIYIPWFMWLELTVVTDYTPVHIWLDDVIPFNEYFIIPYYLWFFYVAITVVFILFTSKEEFYRLSAFLFIGMSICLLICTIWPNGQDLRPASFPSDNIFTRAIADLYSTDTNTNVFPSIHVFNSIGVHIAIMRSQILKKYKWIQVCSLGLAVSIILATMFLKQHSALDTIGSFVLAVIMYVAAYKVDYPFFKRKNDKLEAG